MVNTLLYGMFMCVTRAKRILVLVLVIAVLAIGIWGAVSTGTMMHDGNMQNCPYVGVATLCNMTTLEHFAAWQAMFSAIPANAVSVFLLLTLLAFVLSVHNVERLPFKEQLNLLAVRQRLYTRHSLAFAYASPLQEAFSRGILNPKVF